MSDKNYEKMKDKNYCIEKMFLKESRGDMESMDISYIDTDYLFDIPYDFKHNERKKEWVKKNMNKEFLNLEEKIKDKKIEEKNIRRSKSQMTRIVKANENDFKTFITLTYAENVTDISKANKNFDNWRRSIKRIKNDFKYVCVPEFQKRGAIHYHLLTNLDIQENRNLIIPQKGKKTQYDVKYWNQGFTSVFSVEDINIVGYMSKYMTKDIDNRLWGKRRYLYSQNLKSPTTVYLDLNNIEDFRHYVDIVNSCESKYNSIYFDLSGECIEFEEFKLRKVFT